MCSILGALTLGDWPIDEAAMEAMHERARARGRDGSGAALFMGGGVLEYRELEEAPAPLLAWAWLQNMRAIPTTEIGHDLAAQQQPFSSLEWHVVHNGTIANDAELWADLGREGRPVVDSEVLPHVLQEWGVEGLERVRGSYALAAVHEPTGKLLLAANYKPVYFSMHESVVYFASEPHGLPGIPQKLPAYTYLLTSRSGHSEHHPLPGYVPGEQRERRALVVASGGMDSTVAAASLVADGYEVTLLHVQYDAQAEARELRAVQEIAAVLEVELLTMRVPLFTDAAQSPLTTPGASIADGEAGAEFAHEWVPARNLVLASMATAIAEARGIPFVALGNNLEEAGAYPDNEPEFVRKLNDLMPNAVADGGYVRFIEPVGNLMKHEVAKLGHELRAPVALSWSCYRGGEHHCGECGPCYMRQRAHEFAGVPDRTVYAAR